MATRLYFPADTPADVSPAFDDDWSDTGQAVRRLLSPTKGTSAIAAGTTINVFTGHAFACDRMYVSPPLDGAQTISGTVKGYVMVREYADDDDVTQILVVGKVVSQDGSTVRGFLTPAWHSSGGTEHLGTEGEFINNATHRNKAIANPGTSFNSVAAQHGDRIVWEVGYRANGVTPGASAKWGENATDLPENETQTTDGAPWIEFSQTLAFQTTAAGGGQPATYQILQRRDGQDLATLIALTPTDAVYRTPYFQPASLAQLQAMEIGASRGNEDSTHNNIQVEDAWLMLEFFPIGAPSAGLIDLKQFKRRRFGGGAWG